MIQVVHPGSCVFTHPGYRIQGSKRHQTPDPGSATLKLRKTSKNESSATSETAEVIKKVEFFHLKREISKKAVLLSKYTGQELTSIDRFPGRGGTAGGGPVPPDVVVLVSRLPRHRLLEPLVLVGGVPRHQVHHNLRSSVQCRPFAYFFFMFG